MAWSPESQLLLLAATCRHCSNASDCLGSHTSVAREPNVLAANTGASFHFSISFFFKSKSHSDSASLKICPSKIKYSPVPQLQRRWRFLTQDLTWTTSSFPPTLKKRNSFLWPSLFIHHTARTKSGAPKKAGRRAGWLLLLLLFRASKAVSKKRGMGCKTPSQVCNL